MTLGWPQSHPRTAMKIKVSILIETIKPVSLTWSYHRS